MDQNKTNIFISYRRDGGREIARTVYLALKGLGYKKIFFDYHSLQHGVFNTQIIDAIESCNDFILILTEGSMDRCVNEDDWVRTEITAALEAGCNIIPIKVDNLNIVFPTDFPKNIDAIKMIQQSTLHTDEFFDDSIRYIEQRLISRPEQGTKTKDTGTSKTISSNAKKTPYFKSCVTSGVAIQTISLLALIVFFSVFFVIPDSTIGNNHVPRSLCFSLILTLSVMVISTIMIKKHPNYKWTFLLFDIVAIFLVIKLGDQTYSIFHSWKKTPPIWPSKMLYYLGYTHKSQELPTVFFFVILYLLHNICIHACMNSRVIWHKIPRMYRNRLNQIFRKK